MMSKQLMIYEKAVPISSKRHADWSVVKSGGYEFAGEMTSVPLVAAEFSAAAGEYVMVFAGADKVAPIAILGARDKQNLYLKDDGSWDAQYVPAFLRRYPFVFSGGKDENTFTLCIDEEYDGCNRDGRGERLFDEKGDKTKYGERVLDFVGKYQSHYQRTQQFCEKLKALNLLDPMQAEITSSQGDKQRLAGFMAVSRERLNALPAKKLSELAKSGELELIYLHLQSMRNLAAVLARGRGGEATSPEPAAAMVH